MAEKLDLSNRVVAVENMIQKMRVMRHFEGWEYAVQINIPVEEAAYHELVPATTWSWQWHTIFQSSSALMTERWLSVWLNRPVKLMTDELAALAPETK